VAHNFLIKKWRKPGHLANVTSEELGQRRTGK
jgi:hypothetical protein